MLMETELQRHPGYLVFRVGGDLRLWNHKDREDQLLAQMPENAQIPANHILLDLQDLKYVDSKGITALVRILVRGLRQNCKMSVVLPGGLPGDALRRIHIFAPCQEFPDRAAALAAIQQGQSSAPNS